MSEKLAKLYRTLILIETKGDSTEAMADCLRYLKQLIKESQKESEVE